MGGVRDDFFYGGCPAKLMAFFSKDKVLAREKKNDRTAGSKNEAHLLHIVLAAPTSLISFLSCEQSNLQHGLNVVKRKECAMAPIPVPSSENFPKKNQSKPVRQPGVTKNVRVSDRKTKKKKKILLKIRSRA